VHGDVLQHAFETVGDGEFDVCIGTDSIQRCALEEVDFVLEHLKVFGFDVGCDVHARGAFAHFGFDVHLSLFARDGDAVMTVHDEIDLAHFIQDDRREVDVFVKGAVDFLPAAAS
jgi:hypothetical protein